jgi:hypothetical protein
MKMKLSASNIVGSTPTRGRVKDDYYATHPDSTKALLLVEEILYPALEPACGEGHISKLLDGDVTSNDLENRGYGCGGINFLTWQPDKEYKTIITNPPFSLFTEFMDKSLEITTHKVILFGKLQALEGKKRANKMSKTPLKIVYVFKARQQPLRNGSEIDPLSNKPWASSTMAFAWYVWDKEYKGKPTIGWI